MAETTCHNYLLSRMDMRIPFQITSIGMKGNDKSGSKSILFLLPLSFAFCYLGRLFGSFLLIECIKDRFFGSVKEKIKPVRMMEEVSPKTLINRKNHMTMIDIERASGDSIGSGARHFLTAGRAESAFAGVADNMMSVTIRTFVYFKTHSQGATGNHTSYFIFNILRDRDIKGFNGFKKIIPDFMKD